MAKTRSTILNIAGKLGDEVYVTNKYGSHVRRIPKSGTRKNEPAFKQQHARTASLNRLAAELNKVIGSYAGKMKSRDFYHDVLGKLRNEPSNNRFFLLYPLRKLQVNSRYPFPLHVCTAQLRRSRKKIIVDLSLEASPDIKADADSYYYEVIVVQWTKSEKPCIHNSALSDWIGFGKERASFEFRFPSGPSVIHWLLCLRLQLCSGKKDIETMPCQGMVILDVGSFNKRENELLERRTKEKRMEGRIKKVTDERVRVKAKDG